MPDIKVAVGKIKRDREKRKRDVETKLQKMLSAPSLSAFLRHWEVLHFTNLWLKGIKDSLSQSKKRCPDCWENNAISYLEQGDGPHTCIWHFETGYFLETQDKVSFFVSSKVCARQRGTKIAIVSHPQCNNILMLGCCPFGSVYEQPMSSTWYFQHYTHINFEITAKILW